MTCIHSDRDTRLLAEASPRDVETVLYSISHELRSPLRAIRCFAELLAGDDQSMLSEQGRCNLERVLAAAARMQSMIEDHLRFGGMTYEQPRREFINLSDVARQVLEELRGVDPDRAVDTRIPASVCAYADRRLARILMENLLSNAWKFTSKCDCAVIQFGMRRDAEIVYFVRDNGAGFDPQYVHRLFQPFRRLHSQAEFPGTGMGLAIVRRIIERHGGRIWVESIPGEGTTLMFTLPELPREC